MFNLDLIVSERSKGPTFKFYTVNIEIQDYRKSGMRCLRRLNLSEVKKIVLR